jgi:hypothetical protein
MAPRWRPTLRHAPFGKWTKAPHHGHLACAPLHSREARETGREQSQHHAPGCSSNHSSDQTTDVTVRHIGLLPRV